MPSAVNSVLPKPTHIVYPSGNTAALADATTLGNGTPNGDSVADSGPASSRSSSLPGSPKINNPTLPWVVQKYGGTSVGKFLENIVGGIIP